MRGGHVRWWTTTRSRPWPGPAPAREYLRRKRSAIHASSASVSPRPTALVDVGMFEFSVRDKRSAPKRRAAAHGGAQGPLKVVIENYPEGKSPKNSMRSITPTMWQAGDAQNQVRPASFLSSRTIFFENPPKKFLPPVAGSEVRLRLRLFRHLPRGEENAAGEVDRTHWHLRSGNQRRQLRRTDARSRATIHWVSAVDLDCRRRAALQSAVLLVRSDRRRGKSAADLNPHSSGDRCCGASRPALAGSQGERGRCSSSATVTSASTKRTVCPGTRVFNRTIGLRDTWAKDVAKDSGEGKIGQPNRTVSGLATVL